MYLLIHICIGIFTMLHFTLNAFSIKEAKYFSMMRVYITYTIIFMFVGALIGPLGITFSIMQYNKNNILYITPEERNIRILFFGLIGKLPKSQADKNKRIKLINKRLVFKIGKLSIFWNLDKFKNNDTSNINIWE